MTNTVIDACQVERFRGLIARHLGLHFEDTRMGWLAEVLQRRLSSGKLSPDLYLASLDAGQASAEFGAIAREVTVGETYFFRNIDQFHALRDRVATWRSQAGQRCLRVLSAGCASGEEAYTLAMVLHGVLPDPARELKIRAVDLNPTVIDKARQGRYTAWSLRETPPAMKQRWFRQSGNELLLDEAIRAAVTFEERNLNEDDAGLWQRGAYDIVFCRNVLMYFEPPNARAVVARIAQSLVPGGHLFLGHAETLRGVSQAFHLRHTHGTFYYQLKEGADTTAWSPRPDAATPDAVGCALAAVVDDAGTWVEAIGQAAERVRLLTQAALARGTTVSELPKRWHLDPALDLLREERFTDALGLVRALPPESARDADVLLLQAVLLTHSSQLAEAEEVCHRLLAIDELNAGAHYVLALCREGGGDRRGAADHDQAAVYLDPGFAMPRMHLGLLARHAGDLARVRQEMTLALGLLQREDASRLLLFGGGFNRETLLSLCRAELSACGGAA